MGRRKSLRPVIRFLPLQARRSEWHRLGGGHAASATQQALSASKIEGPWVYFDPSEKPYFEVLEY
jgi:hypothetical protein